MSSRTDSQLSKHDPMADSVKREHDHLEHHRALQHAQPKVGGFRGLLKDKKILGIASIASFGGFLFGFDQGTSRSTRAATAPRQDCMLTAWASFAGVVGNVLVLESFGALFPSIYMDSGRKVSRP